MDNSVRKYDRTPEVESWTGRDRENAAARRTKGRPAASRLEVIGQSDMEYIQRRRENERRRQRMQQQRRKEQRRKAKRRRQLLFLTWQCVFVLAAAFLFVGIKMQLGNAKETQGQSAAVDARAEQNANGMVQSGNGVQGADYVARCGLDEVEAPIQREPEEVLRKLEELAEESEQIRGILLNASDYPQNMLEALANNPEMADFVSGYPVSDGSVTGGFTDAEKQQEHPLFLQWDPRWGYACYGDDSNIGLAGCGPVSLSMALYYLTGDESLTPDRIAAYAMENGYYMSGTGTQWALMEDVPALYGVKVDKPGISESLMRQELDAGNILICAMRPGDFTAAGHFIVIYGYDQDGFWVNDPNCVARSKKCWSYERIGGQIKQLWSIGKS